MLHENADQIYIVKTSSSIIIVEFENNNLKKHTRLQLRSTRLEKQIVSTLCLVNDKLTIDRKISILIGYKNGLIVLADCKKEIPIEFFNYDEKNKESFKKSQVLFLCMLPEKLIQSFVAVFDDSTMLKYYIGSGNLSTIFLEKLKKFEKKISFNNQYNKFKYETKTKNEIIYGKKFFEKASEFNYFYANNLDYNPKSYVKFNASTISDFCIVSNKSFYKNILQSKLNQSINEPTVLAYVSFEGYLIIYEFYQMEPLLSLKSRFGGFNSLTFSPTCELIALGGQDDCIYVLDLNSYGLIKVEGHKSFVSKIIFQRISTHEDRKLDGLQEKKGTKLGIFDKSSLLNHNKVKMESLELFDYEPTKPMIINNMFSPSAAKNKYIRIIAGSFDSQISITEFREDIFFKSNLHSIYNNTSIIQLRINFNIIPIKVDPLVIHKFSDAIGWLGICDNTLAVCTMDGLIHLLNILDYKGENKEPFSVSKLDKCDEEGNEKVRGEETTKKIRPNEFSSNSLMNGKISFSSKNLKEVKKNDSDNNDNPSKNSIFDSSLNENYF